MLWIDLAIVVVALVVLVVIVLSVWGSTRRFVREIRSIQIPSLPERD